MTWWKSKEKPMTNEKRVLPAAFRKLLDEQVKESFETAEYEILDWTQVLHAGWEGDSVAVLVRLPDGGKEVVFADASGVAQVDLEERIAAYETAIAQTRAFLAKWKEAR
jgi:hypothetical protein